MRLRISLLVVFALALALPLTALATGSGTPPVGTSPESVDLSAVDGAVPYQSGFAVPLKGERPAWYTDELSARVHTAAGQPVAAPGDALDAPLPGEVGIRPGSWVLEPYGCTTNFVFQSGGSYAIGTAGHCVDAVGQSVVLLTVAPGGANPVLVDIGTVVTFRNNGIGDDFALIAIRPELNAWVFPTMAVVGGPCGAYSGSGPETVWHYGHGVGIGTGGTPRAGLALRWGANEFGWSGLGIFGDSGSAVRVGTGLQAAGDLTHLVVDTTWLPSYIAGTRIQRMLAIAGGWSLVSSPICV